MVVWISRVVTFRRFVDRYSAFAGSGHRKSQKSNSNEGWDFGSARIMEKYGNCLCGGGGAANLTKAAKFSTILPIRKSNRKWNWLESANQYIYSLVTLQKISGKCMCMCVCEGVIHNFLKNVSSFHCMHPMMILNW